MSVSATGEGSGKERKLEMELQKPEEERWATKQDIFSNKQDIY